MPAAALTGYDGYAALLRMHADKDQVLTELDKNNSNANKNKMLAGENFNFDSLMYHFGLKSGRVSLTGARSKTDFLGSHLSDNSSMVADTIGYMLVLLLNKGVNQLPVHLRNASLQRAVKLFCVL